MPHYIIQSVQTEQYLHTGKDITGDTITTFKHPIGNVVIEHPLEEPVVISPIRGEAGLFVTAHNNHLVWGGHPFPWKITRTIQHQYTITPADGHDLYWTQTSATNTIPLKPGRETKERETFWNIHHA